MSFILMVFWDQYSNFPSSVLMVFAIGRTLIPRLPIILRMGKSLFNELLLVKTGSQFQRI